MRRYTLKEEKTIIGIANTLNDIVYETFKFDPDCRKTLCQHIEAINELHEDVATTFGKKHNTITARNFFRCYEELKETNMLAVASAEAILAAKKAGYSFHLLHPKEREDAKESIQKYQSYIAFKKTTEEIKEGKQDLPIVIINKPFAVFEKYNKKHYIGMIASSEEKDTNLFILSKDAMLVLHTTDLYDPGIGDHKTFIKEHFES